MRVKVVAPFPFSANGTHSRMIAAGEIVEGRAAEVALAEGWGVTEDVVPLVVPEPTAEQLVDRLPEPVREMPGIQPPVPFPEPPKKNKRRR